MSRSWNGPDREGVITARPTVSVAVCDPRRLVAEAMASLVAELQEFVVAELDVEQSGAIAKDPDVVLVGVPSPPGDALNMVVGLRARHPDLPIILVADALDRELVGMVLEHRLSGLLLTDCSSADLAASLRQVSRGNAVLPARWQGLAAPTAGDPLQTLSVRQRDVLELLAEGLSYEEIGARLFISANTVKFHVRGIFLRLGVRNRTAAARFVARRRGEQSLSAPA